MTGTAPTSAYVEEAAGRYYATGLTRGPWHPDHQHAGPPIALVCLAVENLAREHGLTHLSRITANLLRPVPIGEMGIEVANDYAGRNAGHYSARLVAAGKEVARFAERADAARERGGTAGHAAGASLAGAASGAGRMSGCDLSVRGAACRLRRLRRDTHRARALLPWPVREIWSRLRHPLLEGAAPGPYQRVAVAADSSNGISAILDFSKYVFVNSDLTINLLRRPEGEWIGLDARTHLGPDGGGLAESALFDGRGLIGRATQSLSVRQRE